MKEDFDPVYRYNILLAPRALGFLRVDNIA